MIEINKKSIINEKPIKLNLDDKLKRSHFSKNIAEQINNYSSKESITIGLLGKWGCGKTSIVNMMVEYIDKNKIQVINFNPWYFSGRNQLLSDFFEIMAEKLNYNEQKNKESILKIGKHLELYSKILKPVSLIPQLGLLKPCIDSVSEGMDSMATALTGYSEFKNINLVELKEDINNELLNYNKKILIIIDEIDRLENDEIKQIFQLVKSLGDFDNVVYLLSFDQSKVLELYSKPGIGKLYLDKIINIPIFVPEIDKTKINKIFRERLNDIFNGIDEYSKYYWEELNTLIFENGFEDIRELNRFLNIIIFDSYIIEDLNLFDYLMITYLKLYDNTSYEYIRDNKNNFLKKVKLDNIDEIKSERNIDLKKLIDLIYRNPRNRGINNIKYFDVYFKYTLSESTYSMNEMRAFVDVRSFEELENILDKEDNLFKFFDALPEFIGRLDKQKYIYLSILIDKIPKLNGETIGFNKKNEQEIAINNLKELIFSITTYDDKIQNIIDKIDLFNEIKLEFKLELLNAIDKVFDDSELNSVVKNKIESKVMNYLKAKLFTKEILINLNNISKLGVDVSSFIIDLISTDEGMIAYLNALERVVDYELYYNYDEYGNRLDQEIYEVIGILIEDVEKSCLNKEIISYQIVKEKVNQLSDKVKKENSKIIEFFLDAKNASYWDKNDEEDY